MELIHIYVSNFSTDREEFPFNFLLSRKNQGLATKKVMQQMIKKIFTLKECLMLV